MTLYVIGFGAGSRAGMTNGAEQAIQRAEQIFGYSTYVNILRPLFPEKNFIATGMRQEAERVRLALTAAQHHTAALVCSGDPELYGLAGLALELLPEYPGVEVEVVAGVSAAFSGGAVLGAPLTHDFAVISLSDLLTPPEKITKRLHAAAEADFAIVLYNPSSRNRADYLQKACDIILRHRSPETICGYVRNIGREGQESGVLTLAELRDFQADMFTTVYIGNSETYTQNGRMITPRGYRNA